MFNQIKGQVEVVQRSTTRALLAAGAALALSACSTATSIDPPSALNGKGLDTAVNLYGPPAGHVTEAKRGYYVWRRALVFNDRARGCELRVEIGYHNTISRTTMDGEPGACRMFWVQYTAPDAARRQESLAGKQTVAEAGQRHWRPVGEPTETAAISAAGEARGR
jgi:hypothetical protein